MEDETVYLLDMTDEDGDVITIHRPSRWDGDYMMRIHNDDVCTGIIIDGPMACALLGVLAPIARDFKIDEYLKLEME